MDKVPSAAQPSTATENRYDLVTFGETMVRLSAPRGVRLDVANSLDLTIGGAESNVCVALSGLGRRAAWVSALVDNPLGRRIEGELHARAVDTSMVRWADEGRVGVYFLDPGVEPRPNRVHYDRAGSALARVDPDSIDPRFVERSRCLHLTGITPALSESCALVCSRLADHASASGVPITFDVNYRARLWSVERARLGLARILSQISVLLCGAADAASIWGFDGEPEDVVNRLLEKSSAAVAIVTLGGQGAVAKARGGEIVRQAAIPVDVVDPIGAGDAFAAGVIHSWLDDMNDLKRALRAGVAMAALKMTVYGDHAIVTPDELAHAVGHLDRRGADIVR